MPTNKWSPRASRRGWVEVNPKTGELDVRFPWNPKLLEELKSMTAPAERTWNDKKRHWTFRGSVGNKILNWAEKNGLEGVKDAVYELQTFEAEQQKKTAGQNLDLSDLPINATLRPYQLADVAFMRSVLESEGSVGNFNSPGLGKEQPLDAKILTPTGWTTMGEISLGDEVIGSDGNSHKVTGVYPQGEKDIYKITFIDGSSTECGREHLWTVGTRNDRARGKSYRIKTTEEIANDITTPDGKNKWFIPIVNAVNFKKKPLPIDPYVLGLLIGDGGMGGANGSVSFTSADLESVEEIRMRLPSTLNIKPTGEKYVYRIVSEYPGAPNVFVKELKKMGLWGHKAYTKFIPDIYKYASLEDRLALFQGLMDSDGNITLYKRGDSSWNRVEFSTTSTRLASDITFLVQSFGGTARTYIRNHSYQYKTENGVGYIIRVYMALPVGIRPCRLKRKLEKYSDRIKYQPSRSIISVEYIGKKESQCITVDSPDHLYVTDDCILTHNTIESITLCEWGNYFPACILTPQIVKAQFAEEIERFTKHRRVVVLQGEKPYELPSADYYIINPDILQHWLPVLQAKGFVITIADESTYYKSLDSIRQRALKSLNATAKYSVIMTGTPVENKFQDMMGQLDVLGRLDREWGGKDKFIRHFTRVTEIRKPIVVKDSKGKIVKGKNGKPTYRMQTVLQPGEAQNLSEFYNYLTRWSVRHRKEDVLTELPTIQRTIYRMPLDSSKRKEYTEAENDFLTWLARVEGSDAAKRASRAEKLIRMGKLSRLSAEGIVDEVCKWIQNVIENEDEKLIVYAWNKDIVGQIASRFSAPFINGDATPKQKEEARKKFTMDSNCNLLVINYKSGGVGLNLMGTVDKSGERKQCSRVAFLQYPWSPGDMMQSESRIHRMGQQMPVNSYWFVADGTIHQYMVESLQAKQMVATEAVDGLAEQFDITEDVASAMLKQRGK